MLKFMDDTQVSLFGLDETLARIHGEDKAANDETAEEIIESLEGYGNYIPSSERAHKEYVYVLLREYKRYVKEQAEKKE